MEQPIRIAPAEGTWVVRAGGAVIGESGRALRLVEDGHAPVIYFPREDIAMAFLEPSARSTACPWKGEASYFAIVTPDRSFPDRVWSYESPLPGVAQIAGHLAFYVDDDIQVERV